MTLREALLRGRRRPRNFGSGSPLQYRGDGYEFVELRAYVPGDDVRRIDWAATARAGELQTRVVLEDVALTIAATLDTSLSMRVGRRRSLVAAGHDVLDAWFAAATADDRCVRIGSGRIAPSRAERGERSARAARNYEDAAFDLRSALETANAALPRGTAYLVVSDWYGIDDDGEALLARCAARFDCTALIARDPWYDGLPLRGFVRLRGAEGGSVRAFIGKRERERFARAVREREERLRALLARLNWRTGVLHEDDGAASLAAAFGLHHVEAR